MPTIIKNTKEEFVKKGWIPIGETKIKRKSPNQIILGKKYNSLTPIELCYLDLSGRKIYRTKCECGNEKMIYGYLINLGIIKSCGCLHKKQTKSEFGILRRKQFGEAAKNDLYRTYKKGAKKRNLEFDIPFDRFILLIQSRCIYCNSLPYKKSSNKFFGVITYNGLDRVDNSKRYTIDNTVPCCHRCNQSKSNFTLEEFRKWIVNVYNTTILNNNEILSH